ncbi:MAG: HAD family hydrolase [Rhodobacterales bacterium]|nr:HAD family hydrolase [Rhodobacterales bacterium]
MIRALFPFALLLVTGVAHADPLPSWNDTATKDAIIAFVDGVTTPGSADYLPEADRIAVFDNDGTLWAEQPFYFQVFYALDAVKAKAEADPSILTTDVLKAAAAGDLKTVLAGGTAALGEIVMASHADMTAEAFNASVANWAATAIHPQTGLRFADMTYQPMTELLRYLRDEGFSTWIVTGGGSHFVRAFAEDAYGIPPEQVIGSMIDSEYRVIDGVGQIWKLPDIAFVDDKGGKPVGIDRNIGRRPILAFGNSDGDFEMIEYTTTGPGPSLGLILHHTDGAREWAYDRDSHIGKLERGLDEAAERGWIMVDMAGDWSRIYSGDPDKAD